MILQVNEFNELELVGTRAQLMELSTVLLRAAIGGFARAEVFHLNGKEWLNVLRMDNDDAPR